LCVVLFILVQIRQDGNGKPEEMTMPFSSLCEVPEVIIVKALEILLVQQDLDALLDITNLWHKPLPNLVDSLAYELLVLHALPGLHDSDNRGLGVQLA